MIQFFMLRLHFGGLHVSDPKIWIADSGRRKGVQNLGLGVQNCTKWVQNYDPVFYVEDAFRGLHGSNPPNLNYGYHKKGGCTEFGTRRPKLYKMSTKLWSSFLCWNCIWTGGGVGCMSPDRQILIAHSARRIGVQNLGLGVQNRTK